MQQAVWGEEKFGRPFILNDYELKMYANYIFYLDRKIGERVTGKLYDLTDEQISQSDAYEGDSYERVTVKQYKEEFQVYIRKVKEA